MAISRILLKCASLGGAIVFLAIAGVGCRGPSAPSDRLQTEDQLRRTLAAAEPQLYNPDDLSTAPHWPLLPKHTLGTTHGGRDYIQQCAEAAVPIPPPINLLAPKNVRYFRGWKRQGIIPPGNRFAAVPLGEGPIPAELLSYDTPNGICLQLRDSTSENEMTDTSGTTSVICLSMRSSKACFWEVAGNIPARVQVPIGMPDPGSPYFAPGGHDLPSGEPNFGEACTTCHAGENPFIIHPDLHLSFHLTLVAPAIPANPHATPPTPAFNAIIEGDAAGPPMNQLVGSDGTTTLPLFAPDFYDPIVQRAWPQNDHPASDVDVPEVCSNCHSQGYHDRPDRRGGRFPEFRDRENSLMNYCFSILTPAVYSTMPAHPYTPGSAVEATQSWRLGCPGAY